MQYFQIPQITTDFLGIPLLIRKKSMPPPPHPTSTHPKTHRMKFYNSVIEDTHLSTSGSLYKNANYLREQQSFRWDFHVRLEKLSEKVEFYNNSASGIPKYCNITKDNIKKCDRNVCTSLLCKVEASVIDAEKLDGELKQRRERLLHGPARFLE